MRVSSIVVGALCAQAAAAICTYPKLYSATIEELSSGLEKGCFTSVDLVKAYFARIAEVDEDLHVIIELNPDALLIAASLDAARANGTILGPLHGVPVLVKDNIATFDQMNNTAGSYALVGATVPRDSGVVARLKAGGAIILGKTNMSQWAMFRSSNSTNGWTSRAGQTYGGYYPNMDAYGSSSGSGVAAALGLAFAALGTETRGSILDPASKGNIVGIKPSFGLTSRYLVIPISDRQDTVGPLARTVRDAATILSVIAGLDEYDNYTSAIPNGGKLPDYVAATTKYANLSGVRIGVPRNAIEDDLLLGPVNRTYILDVFETAIDVLRSLGAEIVDSANFSAAAHLEFNKGYSYPGATNQSNVCSAGFISGMATYFAELTSNPNNLHTVAELRNWTASNLAEDYPDRDMISWDGALSLGYNETDERAYKAWEAAISVDAEGGITGICNQLNLSAVIIPSEWAATWASSPGLPAVSVPLGSYPDDVPIQAGLRELIAVAPGIPFGLSFLGPHWSEETLIAIAAAYERTTNYRDAYVISSNATLATVELIDIITGNTTSNSTVSTPTSIPTQITSAGTIPSFHVSLLFMVSIATSLIFC